MGIIMRIIQQFEPGHESADKEHEILFREQVEFMKEVKIEFYKTLDFGK